MKFNQHKMRQEKIEIGQGKIANHKMVDLSLIQGYLHRIQMG